jgi:hypothetical protein
MPYQITHPDKQAVRDWMRREVAAKTPPPTPERIREQLGWNLIKDDKPRH